MGLLDAAGLKGGINVGGLLSGGGISGAFNKVNQGDKLASQPNSELKELYKAEAGIKSLQYPADLDNDHYLLFNVQKRVPKVDGAPNNPVVDPKTYVSIALPVPLNLRDELGVQYNNQALGIFGGAGAGMDGKGLAKDLKTSLSMFGLDAGGQAAGQAADFFSEMGIVGTVGAGAALYAGSRLGMLAGVGVAAATAQYAQGYAFNKGIAYNPRMAVMFDNVNFRTFNFTYRMMARNAAESRVITEIVNAFKYHMLPSYSEEIVSGAAFTYPDEFQLQFADSIRKHLFDFKPCVLTSVSASYNSESGPAFFKGEEAPIMVDLNLSFQEVKIWAKNEPKGVEAEADVKVGLPTVVPDGTGSGSGVSQIATDADGA